jgi:hypothetical protein
MNRNWGYLRRPAFLAPVVAAVALMIVIAVKTPGEVDPVGVLAGLPFLVLLTLIFASIPMVVAAVFLLVVCRALPRVVVSMTPARMAIGGLVGCLVGLPFTYMLNWIPSATDGPRFDYLSMLIASAVTGAYCALFYSEARAD